MKKFMALLLTAVMLLSLSACGGNNNADSSNSNNNSSQTNTSGTGSGAGAKTLNVGTQNVLGTLMPGDANGSCYWGEYLVYDYLFDYDDDGNITSDILSDWYYEDELTFVVVLKDGITFANGDAMTGEDVLFSVQTLVDRGTTTANWYNMIDFDASSVSEDGLTVRFVYTKEFGPGLAGGGTIYILDKSWCEEKGFDNIDDWTLNTNGSGPYEPVEYATDSHLTLALRDDYWGDFEATADTIIIHHYADVSAMYMALETGELDIALNVNGPDYSRALEDDSIDEFITYEGECIMFCFDTSNEALSDQNVRLAIAYGVNWEEVAQSAMGEDMAQVATSIISTISPYYTNVGAYEYDFEKASAYMEAAGYPVDGTMKVSLTMNTVDQAVKRNAATVIQYYLQQLGIDFTVNYSDFPTAMSRWTQEGGTDTNFNDTNTGSPLVGEPYNFLQRYPAGQELFPCLRISDEKFIELFNTSSYSTDEEVRKDAYAEMQQLLKDTAYFIPMYESVKAIAYNPDTIAECGLRSAIAANLRMVVMQ